MISTRCRMVAVCLVAFACGNDGIRSGETPAEYAVRLAASNDASYLVDRMAQLEGSRGEEYAVDEGDLIWAGYEQLMRGRIGVALVIQQTATAMFPQSARAWENLGEAAIYLGDRDLAERSFQRSLALDSTGNSWWMLEDLDRQIQQAANETEVVGMFEPGEPTGLAGPFLGQTPPGRIPEIFAPGVVSTRGGHEFSCTFTPDGREFYFNRGPNIFVSYWRENGWTAPDYAPFNSDRLDHEPFIPSDGSRLFFGSGRDRQAEEGEDLYGIWVMERFGDGWGPPEYLFPGMYVTTSMSGDAYVTDVFRTVGGGLCVYRWQGGEYGDCERLSGGVNDIEAAHPLIAPDESFLLFDANDDLFVSFPTGNGEWTPGTRVNEISDLGAVMTASLSPDSRFLFFYANHDIYWVSAEVLQPYVISFLASTQR